MTRLRPSDDRSMPDGSIRAGRLRLAVSHGGAGGHKGHKPGTGICSFVLNDDQPTFEFTF